VIFAEPKCARVRIEGSNTLCLGQERNFSSTPKRRHKLQLLPTQPRDLAKRTSPEPLLHKQNQVSTVGRASAGRNNIPPKPTIRFRRIGQYPRRKEQYPTQSQQSNKSQQMNYSPIHQQLQRSRPDAPSTAGQPVPTHLSYRGIYSKVKENIKSCPVYNHL
jgi:hypothetical protein